MGELELDTGKTQSYARYLNNRLVMRELMRGSCSSTMLASKLSLSNAAMSAIIGELSRRDYIKQVQGDVRPVGTSGRKPVFWSVNEKFGSVVVISLADYVAKVVVSDMKMNITDSVETRVERYDVAMLYELALTVKTCLPPISTAACRYSEWNFLCPVESIWSRASCSYRRSSIKRSSAKRIL